MIVFYWITEYIFSFIEIFMSFIFCDSFLTRRINMYKEYVLISSCFVAGICIFCNFYSMNSSVLSIVLLLLCLIANYIIREKNSVKLIFIILIYYSLMFVTDLIFLFISKILFGLTSFESFSEFSIPRTITAASSKMLLIIVCTSINKWSDYEIWNKKTGTLISISAVFLTLITYATYMVFVQEKYINTSLIMMIFFIVMLAMIIIIYCSLNSLIKTEKKKQEYEMLQFQSSVHEKNLKEQDNAFELWRESIHNYKNTMIAMQTMLNENKINELSSFVDKEVSSFKNKGIYVRTGNSIFDTIINSKMRFAEKLGITFTVNARMVEQTRISDIHLSILIGNLLDNAIESQKDEISKNINISVSIKKSFLFIEISNSYTKEYFSTDTLKEDGFHGIGLKSVRRIVEEYEGFFSIQRENKYVVATIIIEY